MTEKIIIVGAGVGGLATAARLASRGFDVEVFEKLSRCGGRNHLLEDKGFRFDMGPSFVLMPDFFEEVFSYCGRDIKDYLDFMPVDPSYIIFFPDGRSLTIYRDSAKTKAELEKFEKGAAAAYERLIQETARLYGFTRPLLLRCFTPQDLLDPSYWPLLFKLRALESYWGLVKKFFKSEALCYAFTFEAMFMGVSPFQAPAFYSIITYADHVQKIFHPRGGMYQIPQALERMAISFGARFFYDEPVRELFKADGAFVVKTERQERMAGEVVVNADYSYVQEMLLRRDLARMRYSCSVTLLYLGLKKKISGLAHHNLFFARDLKKNLREIFLSSAIPQDPSFYVHVPTVTDTTLAPDGKEIVYVLIPVPNLENPVGDYNGSEEKELRDFVFKKINKVIGENMEDLIEVEHRFMPQDFIRRYNIKYGATFGLAHTLGQSAFFRPANMDRKQRGLYYVGASTQPGGGLPPVMASSRIVADLITGARNP